MIIRYLALAIDTEPPGLKASIDSILVAIRSLILALAAINEGDDVIGEMSVVVNFRGHNVNTSS